MPADSSVTAANKSVNTHYRPYFPLDGEENSPRELQHFRVSEFIAPIAVTDRQIKNVPIRRSPQWAPSRDVRMICGIHVQRRDTFSLCTFFHQAFLWQTIRVRVCVCNASFSVSQPVMLGIWR